MPAMLAPESLRRHSSAAGSRMGGCSVLRKESGTRSRSEELSECRPCRGGDTGGVSGVENGRGEEPSSDDEEDDWVNGEGSRKNSSPESERVGSCAG